MSVKKNWYQRVIAWFWPKSEQELSIAQRFNEKFNYFSRYKNTNRFGLAWWYGLASAGLFFFTLSGYLLEAVNVANHYGSFVRFTALLNALLNPIPLYIVTLAVFGAFVLWWSNREFNAVVTKCKNAYQNTQKDFLKSLKKQIVMEKLFVNRVYDVGLPEGYRNQLSRCPKSPDKDQWKRVVLSMIHGAVAAFGWLQALAAFTGWQLFSMAPIIGGVFPPILLSGLFMALMVIVSAKITGVVKVVYKYHMHKQEQLDAHFGHQFDKARIHALSQNLLLAEDMLRVSCENLPEADDDGNPKFPDDEMVYAMEYMGFPEPGGAGGSPIANSPGVDATVFGEQSSVDNLPIAPSSPVAATSSPRGVQGPACSLYFSQSKCADNTSIVSDKATQTEPSGPLTKTS